MFPPDIKGDAEPGQGRNMAKPARGILEGFKAIEGEKVGVYMLDQKLGAR